MLVTIRQLASGPRNKQSPTKWCRVVIQIVSRLRRQCYCSVKTPSQAITNLPSTTNWKWQLQW